MTRQTSRWKRFISWWTLIRILAVVLLAIAVTIGVLGYVNQHGCLYVPSFFIADFYANVSTELASIALTVLIIDNLYQRYEAGQEKERLINQLGSWNNTLAMQAADELRRKGWLQDGSARKASLIGADLRLVNLSNADLRGVSFHEAKLQRASLVQADLRGAGLDGAKLMNALLYSSIHYEDGQIDHCEADLQGASLRRANLSNAQVRDEQLVQAGALRDAIMPDGNRYDGRFNLEGEFDWVRSGEIDTRNPEAMARFYDVSLEEYRRGQEWAQENLSRLRSKSS